jgi:hypothetical protein
MFILRALLAWVLFAGMAFAQSDMHIGMDRMVGPASATAASGPTVTPFAPNCYNGGFISSISYTVSIGRGVIAIGIQNSTITTPPTAVTIGGQAATGTLGTATGNGAAAFYYDNSAGTVAGSTATLAYTVVGGVDISCASTALITGVVSNTPTVFAATSGTSSAQPYSGSAVTISAPGVAWVWFGNNDGPATTGLPLSWTNATEDAVTEIWTANKALIGSAHMTASATPTVGCGGASCSYQNWSIFEAAWH